MTKQTAAITVKFDENGEVISMRFGDKIVTQPKYSALRNPPNGTLVETKPVCNLWIYRDEKGVVKLRPPTTVSLDENGEVISMQFGDGKTITQPPFNLPETLPGYTLVGVTLLCDLWTYKDENGYIQMYIHKNCVLYCP